MNFPFAFWGATAVALSPNEIPGLLAWFSPEEQGASIGAGTLVNLTNGNIEGTVTSPAAVVSGDDSIKEVEFGLNGRVEFGNRYKPVSGVTIVTIMKNIDLADTIQFHGGMGTTGDDGFLLFKNGGTQIAFRANTGNGFVNQIFYNGAYVLNEWQMFAGTYDSITSRIFKNSTLVKDGGNAHSGNISYVGIVQHFWATVQGNTTTIQRYWNGSGRVYLIYNRALTEDEIKSLYLHYKNLGFVM